MWQEYVPDKEKETEQALVNAEKQLMAFEADKNDATWQADCLKLCRDVSMAAKLLEAADRNDRTVRLARITHLKEQNRIGAGVVTTFTDKSCVHMPIGASNADAKLGEALVFFKYILFANPSKTINISKPYIRSFHSTVIPPCVSSSARPSAKMEHA